ncbi:MAG: lipopolysaccharide biosynthesis protein RfbH [Oscillospiraceae bacterium]|nr:lipopolysaccharide biosynthesis protein RfbH [Oscillospiraceae bacterium]
MNESAARAEILAKVREYCRNFHSQGGDWSAGERIAYSRRIYDGDEMTALVDSALDFVLTADRYTEKFEELFARYLGAKHCFFVNSGSSANLLAFMALTSPLLGERAIKRGDEVLTVAASFPTTVAPILQFGATPVFVDVSIPQYNVDVTALEQAYSPRMKAVFLAHTLGNPFDIAAVKAFCDRHCLWLIEDNCDALGSEYMGNAHTALTGVFGDISTASFYPPHHITTGEGGAVCTSDPLLAKIVRSVRDWGRDCSCPAGHDDLCGRRFQGQYGTLPADYDHKYVFSHFGYNLKATDMQGAIGCEQLKKLPRFIEKRRANFEYLYKLLKPLEDKLILPQALPNSRPSWFGFPITCREGVQRRKIVEYLESQNIQTRMLFSGNILRHPCFDRVEKSSYRVAGGLKNTNIITERTFWLGVYPGLNETHLRAMAKALSEAVEVKI